MSDWKNLTIVTSDVVNFVSRKIYHNDFPELYVDTLTNDIPAMISACKEQDLAKLTTAYAWATKDWELPTELQERFQEAVAKIENL